MCTLLEGKSKTSQSREVRDRLNAAAFLKNGVKLN